MEMITRYYDTEHPKEHWEFIECDGKVAIDLGCGRWEKVEQRDFSWPTTPEWLAQQGASHVYAFDIDPEEVEWYNNNVDTTLPVTTMLKGIYTVDDVRYIWNTYKPKIVKCDIEGFESKILELTNEEFSMIDLWAVETHSDELEMAFKQKFLDCGYTLFGYIHLSQATQVRVLFAKKIKY
jgi:hypothetical protein